MSVMACACSIFLKPLMILLAEAMCFMVCMTFMFFKTFRVFADACGWQCFRRLWLMALQIRLRFHSTSAAFVAKEGGAIGVRRFLNERLPERGAVEAPRHRADSAAVCRCISIDQSHG